MLPQVQNQLATHVPDLVLAPSSLDRQLPFSQRLEGMLMFADISGFTALCEKYSLSSRSNGTDKLSKTLNDYLGAIVENIIGSEGDVLKFAGDAFIALWRVQRDTLDNTIIRVIKCALRIQEKCDNWNTDVGVRLRVKIGLSIGPMQVTYIGNDECQQVALSSTAVDDANQAEKFAQPGDIILSPKVWAYAPDHDLCHIEKMSDNKHIRVISYGLPPPEEDLLGLAKQQELQANAISGALLGISSPGKRVTSPRKKMVDDKEAKIDEKGRLRPAVFRPPSKKEKEVLRKYVIKPVLKKIEDGQPLEYLSEMRQVSVVFINIIFVPTKDAEDTNNNLQHAFNIIYSNCRQFRGCLNKIFMFDKGCTFLVIYGLPGDKHEEDCAHALKSSHVTLDQLKATPLVSQVSIGVTTGSSFCGVVGHKHRHEYTVIGRKVNMAARLMMHYPDKLSCDPETFHHSKQPRHFFKELPHKEMKGVRNPGTIHEYLEGSENNMSVPLTVTEFEFPILGREKEIEECMLQLRKMKENPKGSTYSNIVIYDGESGIGKTRMLDAIIIEAMNEGVRVLPLALTINDHNTPYYTVRSLIQMLMEMEGCQSHVEREHILLKHTQNESIREDLCLLNDLLMIKMPNNPKFVMMNIVKQNKELRSLLMRIVSQFTTEHSILFVIDDAHYIDKDSWDFLADLTQTPQVMCVLSMRPFTKEYQPSASAKGVLSGKRVVKIRLRGLKSDQMASLACQLLDVKRVPIELVKLLKERSQGVPSWCEQLTREMLSEGHIQVVSHSNTISKEANQVSPSSEAIQKRRGSDGSSGSYSRSRRGSLDVKDTGSLKTPVLGTQLLERLQDIAESTNDDDDTYDDDLNEEGMICIVTPDVVLANLPVPNSMKGMLMARIDRMKPSEQMVVKCAAILGITFTRAMLEVIVPNCNIRKLRRSLQTLMQTHVFECATPPSDVAHTQRLNIKFSSQQGYANRMKGQIECHCMQTEDDEIQDREGSFQCLPVTGCKFLRFCSTLMQETAYGLFLINQRRTLHEESAIYLESQAHKCKHCGGGDFIPGHHSETGGKTEKIHRTTFSTTSITSRRGAVGGKTSTDEKFTQEVSRQNMPLNKVGVSPKLGLALTTTEGTTVGDVGQKKTAKIGASDVKETKEGENAFNQRKGRSMSLRKSSISSQLSIISVDDSSENRGGNNESILEVIDMRECECPLILNTVYPQLVRHWRAAANTEKTIHFLAEAGSAAVSTDNNLQALSYLNEAQDLIRTLDAGEKPLCDDVNENINVNKYERAHVESTMGQAIFQMGRYDESKIHFLSALRILGNRQRNVLILTRFKIMLEGIKQFAHRKFPNCFIGRASSEVSNIYVEQARCLSYLWQIYLKKNDKLRALSSALQQLNRAESSDDDLHELITAYRSIMECCQLFQWPRLGDFYERMAMRRCIEGPGTFGPDDVITVGHLYSSSSNLRLGNGRLQGAIDAGYSALRIAKRLHNIDLELAALPTLAQALLQANRLTPCVENLEALRYAADEEENNVSVGWYFCGCMDLLLEAGFTLEDHNTCIDYCTRAMSEKAFSVDTTPRLYLITCLALWYSRKGNWEKASRWMEMYDELAPHHQRSTLVTVQSNFKVLECRLLHVCRALKEGGSGRQENAQVDKIFSKLKSKVKLFPVLKPRLMHLRAYRLMLDNQRTKAQKVLQTCIDLSKQRALAIEEHWAKHSCTYWFDPKCPKTLSSHWLQSVEKDLDWHSARNLDATMVKYSLPLPYIK
ncbi:adenylate cyclase type 10-like [Anneissia japonica]|uniref:adenylate cyclase type 10-like n=1 Tax=Anneissia japonica TaxID=1529436 RepID=UPI001425A36A|nr:adenylate cyclase type 10-like [Anneissia japonica]